VGQEWICDILQEVVKGDYSTTHNQWIAADNYNTFNDVGGSRSERGQDAKEI
jgi:hypothetical protein